MREKARAGGRWTWLLDAGIGLLVLGSVALLVHDRVLPAWRSREAVDPGQKVPRSVRFTALAGGGRISVPRGAPALYLVFQSTCPACAAAVPAWRRMISRRPPGLRAYAVGLEPRESGLAYAREKLPDALAVRPADVDRFARVFRLQTVPTTLIVGRGGRLLWRYAGVPGEADVSTFRLRAAEAVGGSGGSPRAASGGQPENALHLRTGRSRP